jgi:chromosome segregation ATPase
MNNSRKKISKRKTYRKKQLKKRIKKRSGRVNKKMKGGSDGVIEEFGDKISQILNSMDVDVADNQDAYDLLDKLSKNIKIDQLNIQKIGQTLGKDKARLEDLVEYIDQLSDDVQETELVREQLENTEEAFEEQRKVWGQLVQDMEIRVESAEDAKEEMSVELINSNEELKSIREENERLLEEASKEKCGSELDELEQKNQTLIDRNTLLEKKGEEVKDLVRNALGEHKELKALKAESIVLVESVKRGLSEVNILKGKIGTLENENKGLKGKSEAMVSESVAESGALLDSSRKEIQRLGAENEQLKGRLEQGVESLACQTANETNNTLTNENETIKRKLEEVTKKLNMPCNAAAELKQKILDLKPELAETLAKI